MKIYSLFFLSLVFFIGKGVIGKTEEKASKEKEKIEYAKETLLYGTTKERLFILTKRKFLMKHKDIFIPILKNIYKSDEHYEVRAKIIKFFDKVSLKDICEVILDIDGIKDISSRLKSLIASILGKYKCKNGFGFLKEIVENENLSRNSNLLLVVIDAIGRLGGKEAGEFLSSLLKKKNIDPTVKARIILAIGNSGYKNAMDQVASFFKDEDEPIFVRAYAANALGKLNALKYRELLLNELKKIESKSAYERNRERVLYLYIVGALAKMKEKGLSKVLERALRNDSSQVRSLAAKLAGEVRDSSLKNILLYRAKYDESRKVRIEAVKALGKICPKGIIEKLEGLLAKERSISVKEVIKEAISSCEKHKKTNVRELED